MPVARADNENANENENGKTGKRENVANRKSGYSIDKRIIYFLFFGSATKQTPVKP